MGNKAAIDSALRGKVIALPESRQLDVLTDLFARRGANVLRVPLIAIADAPDQIPVVAWLRAFIESPPDYLIVLTGEGLRRLHGAAQRNRFDGDFIAALHQVSMICRGPKPGRVLKEWGLTADLLGQTPTTQGIIATLDNLPLSDKRVAVQLYGEDPNHTLMEYLSRQGLQACFPVAPYIYANESDTERVKSLIFQLAADQIDLIAFTSQPQVHRLFDVATRHNLAEELREGLTNTRIAAIGPVVAKVLKDYACEVDIMPTKSFFMKPLVTAAEQLFAIR